MDHKHKKEIDNWAQQQTHLFNPGPTPQTLNEEYCHPFTPADLANALKTMNYKSTPGEDTIPYRAIKELPDEAKAQLLGLENRHRKNDKETKQAKRRPRELQTYQPPELPGQDLRKTHHNTYSLIHKIQQVNKHMATRLPTKERSQRTHLHPRKLHQCSQNQEKN